MQVLLRRRSAPELHRTLTLAARLHRWTGGVHHGPRVQRVQSRAAQRRHHRCRPVGVVDVQIEDPHAPHARLAQDVDGSRRIVEVATTAEPTRARVMARGPAQGIYEALPLDDQPRRRDRRAHPLEGSGGDLRADRCVRFHPRRRELRHQPRATAARGASRERAQEGGVVHRVQSPSHVLPARAGRHDSHPGVAHEALAHLCQALVVIVRLKPSAGVVQHPRLDCACARLALDQQHPAHERILRIRGPLGAKPLPR